MRARAVILTLLLAALLLSGCGTLDLPALLPTFTPQPSWTPLATWTPRPTPLPSATPSPSPTPFELARAGTPLPQPLPPLTAENAAELRLLAVYGRGLLLHAQWSGDGRSLWVGGTRGLARLDAASLTETLFLPAPPAAVLRAWAVSADGRWAAAGAQDGRVFLWDAQTGALAEEPLPGAGGSPVLTMAFSPDSNRLAAAAWDRRVNWWALDTRAGRSLRSRAPLRALGFTPDGAQLLGWAAAGQPEVWELPAGRRLDDFYIGLTTGGGSARGLAFSADGSTLAANQSSRLRVFRSDNRTTRATLTAFRGPLLAAALSADGSRAATLEEAAVRVWETDSRALVQEFPAPPGAQAGWRLAFAPDGGRLLLAGDGLWVFTLGSQEPALRWEAAAWARAQRLWTVPLPAQGLRVAQLDGWESLWRLGAGQADAPAQPVLGPYGALALSPKGDWRAVSRADGKVMVYAAGETTPTWTLSGHRQTPLALAFSADGNWLASGSREGALRLWDLQTGKAALKLELKEDVQYLAFSPAGDALAVGLRESTRLLELTEGRVLATYPGTAPVFAPSGQQLALALPDSSTRLVSLSGGPSITLAAAGRAAAFSPDGALLAVSGAALSLWDTRSGEQVTAIENPAPFAPPQFSADGELLLISDWDGVVYLWGVW